MDSTRYMGKYISIIYSNVFTNTRIIHFGHYCVHWRDQEKRLDVCAVFIAIKYLYYIIFYIFLFKLIILKKNNRAPTLNDENGVGGGRGVVLGGQKNTLVTLLLVCNYTICKNNETIGFIYLSIKV